MKPSDIDNLVKNASNVKNVESVITSGNDNRQGNNSKRFQEIQFVDLEQDTHRTHQNLNTDTVVDSYPDREHQEIGDNECTTESALNH